MPRHSTLPPAPRLERLQVGIRFLVKATHPSSSGDGAPASAARQHLSPIDHAICPATLYQMLLFRGELPVDLLQASLATTLQLYPLLAGRLVVDKGMYAVRCNNAGALFITASCGNSLQDFLPPTGPQLSRQVDLLPLTYQLRMPIELRAFAGRPRQHLLGVAALQLAGGDSAVMLMLPHALADLTSNRGFVQHWSSVMRRMQQQDCPNSSFTDASQKGKAEAGAGAGAAAEAEAAAQASQLRAEDAVADLPSFGWHSFHALADAGEALEATLGPAEREALLPSGPAGSSTSNNAGSKPCSTAAAASSVQQQAPAAALEQRKGAMSMAFGPALTWPLGLLIAVLRQLQLWTSFYSAPATDTLHAWLQVLRLAVGQPAPPHSCSVWPCTLVPAGAVEAQQAGSTPAAAPAVAGCSPIWLFTSRLASRYRSTARYLLARLSLIWHTQVLGAGDVMLHVSTARLAELKAQAQAQLQAQGMQEQQAAGGLSPASSRDLLVELQQAAGALPADPPAETSTNTSTHSRASEAQQAVSTSDAHTVSRNDALLARVWQVLGGLPGSAGRLSAVYLAVDMRRRLPQQLPACSFGNWLLLADTPWLLTSNCTLGALAATFRCLVRSAPQRFKLECAAMRRKAAAGRLIDIFWRHMFWIPWLPCVVTNWDWRAEDADFGCGARLIWICGGFNTTSAGVVKLIRALDGSGDVYVHFQVSAAAAAAMFSGQVQL